VKIARNIFHVMRCQSKLQVVDIVIRPAFYSPKRCVVHCISPSCSSRQQSTERYINPLAFIIFPLNQSIFAFSHGQCTVCVAEQQQYRSDGTWLDWSESTILRTRDDYANNAGLITISTTCNLLCPCWRQQIAHIVLNDNYSLVH
jgi:hypothetical protein